MTPRLRRLPVALLAAGALALAACAPGAQEAPGVAPAAAEPALSGELVVFAAASLQLTFTQLGEILTADHPDLRVTFNFGSSGTLATQIVAGAPADVFAAANSSTMTDAAAVVNPPTVFAHNSLVIVTPAGNPAGITGLADLANPDLKIALCDPSAPCGSAATSVLTAAGLTGAPDTFGQNVSATLQLVTEGEVDAALVYATDGIAAHDHVETITFPEADGAVNVYPIATLREAANPAAAEAFVALVLSATGQQILASAGFGAA